MVGLAAASVFFYAQVARALPAPEEIRRVETIFETTQITDRSGQTVLYEVIDPLGGDRQWVYLNTIPQHVKNATVAIEDKTFYANPGFDLVGMGRALWSNFTGGQVQGASTITQQLVKNVLIPEEQRTKRDPIRKVQEIILATEISRRYTKDQILEWYLNTNFYGHLAYGIQAAARVYFDKSVTDLTLAEAALLAAIPQFPYQNPIDNPDAARLRQSLVLDAMAEQGYITQEEADRARSETIVVIPPEWRFNILAPHFSIYARQEAEAILNAMGMDGAKLVSQGGLKITTTLNLELQHQAECVARSHLARLSGADPAYTVPAALGRPCNAAAYLPALPPDEQGIDHYTTNAAIVTIRATTGEILAMVGSTDYYDDSIDGQFNTAIGLRQPGSAFKPFTYVTAFGEGYSPATMVLDIPKAYPFESGGPSYNPVNFDRSFHGAVSLREALANSYNVPTVEVMKWTGIGDVIDTAHLMGINSINGSLSDYGLALSLGSAEVSLLDLTYAYSVFADMGRMNGVPIPTSQRITGYRGLDPAAVLRIADGDGKVLWELNEAQRAWQSVQVLDPKLAYLINDVLSDEQARWPAMGRDNALELSRPAAAKTGTTDDFRDSWTAGYTPQLVTGVWVGNNDNAPMVEVSGLLGAAPIWHAVMEYAHRDLPIEVWPVPDGIVTRRVCEKSGMLPTEKCGTVEEIFIEDFVPREQDTYWRAVRVNPETGRLAAAGSPYEERVFFVYPEEAQDWAREAGIPQPPTEYDPFVAPDPDLFGAVAIIDPKPFSYVGGVVEIRGNVEDGRFAYYRLSYGEGLNPARWNQIEVADNAPKLNEVLGEWDVSGLNGLYSLRLTLVRTDNSIDTFTIHVTIDNRPPLITLLYPQEDQVFRSPGDEFIALQAEAQDNVELDRVEFYLKDKLIATTTVYPWTARWEINRVGWLEFLAVAYDAAGNRMESNHARVHVRPAGIPDAPVEPTPTPSPTPEAWVTLPGPDQ